MGKNMLLSKIVEDGALDGEYFGVELDTYCSLIPKGLRKISFKLDLDAEGNLADDYIAKIMVWGVASDGLGVESMVEIQHDVCMDYERFLHGLSSVGLIPVLIPPENGDDEDRSLFFKRSEEVIDWSLTKDFSVPIYPSCGILSNMMAVSHMGGDVAIDSYTQKTFGGERFDDVLDELFEIEKIAIQKHIGGEDEFKLFTSTIMNSVVAS